MSEGSPSLPNNWFSKVKDDVVQAQARLKDAQRLLECAEQNRDPGIDLVHFAKCLYAARRGRVSFFPASLFAEPGWDLLLDLYIARNEGRTVTTSSACIASGVPSATALRWIEILAKAGFLSRLSHPKDKRLILVALTDDAARRMDDLLSHAALQFPFKRLTP